MRPRKGRPREEYGTTDLRATTLTITSPAYVNAKQLAALLGKNQRTVLRWARKGVLPPPIRLTTRAIVWNLDEVRRFLEARKGGAAS